MSDASYTIEVSGQSVIHSFIQSIIEAPTDTHVCHLFVLYLLSHTLSHRLIF